MLDTIDTTVIKEKENQIVDFLYFWGRPIRAGDLVKELKIKHSTLNSILLRLVKEKLIVWEKYGLVKFTEQGREHAAHLSNHHFILERFLKDTLKMTEAQAHHQAIHLAGVCDCELIDAICKKFSISHSENNASFCESREYPILQGKNG